MSAISPDRGSAAAEIEMMARQLLTDRLNMLPEGQQDRLHRMFPKGIDAIAYEDVTGVIDLANRSIVANSVQGEQ